MRSGRLLAALGRLLPPSVRRDVYEPSIHDARIDHLARLHAATTPARRVRARVRFAAAVAAILLECLRFAPAGAWAARRHRADVEPQPSTELTPMLVYLARHAFRLLARERAFTVAAVLTLALGVGANVAIFAVVEAVMLRPLPYPDAEHLVILHHRDLRTGITKQFIALGDFIDLHARQSSFERLAAYNTANVMVYTGQDPFRASVLQAGPGLLETLAVSPFAGRTFTDADAAPGAAPVAILGHEVWRTRLAGDRAVVGRRIRMGQVEREIVGIAPPGFQFPAGSATDVLLPVVLPRAAPAERKSGWTFAVGRLKPGVTLEQSATALSTLSQQLAREYPQSNDGSRSYPESLRDALLGHTKQPLLLLFAAVGVVLLIACANVGNLLLARALGRRQEMAVRVALGASRGRLAAQLVVESLVLALVAGGVGLLIAYWGVPALVSLVPRSVEVPGLLTVGINAGVMGFTLAICTATALLFALVSVLMIRTESGASALVAQTRVTAGRAARRATSSLVVAEIALAVVLVISAGLILRSFARLLSVDPGFRIERVLVLNMALPPDRYQAASARQAFYTRALPALREVAGVEQVGGAAVTPLTGNNWTVPFDRADRPVPAGQRPPDVGWQAASRGFFEALHIPLVAGRLFDPRDTPDGAPVVIVSEAVQKQFFGEQSAVGQRVKLGQVNAEIVGVVGNIRRAGLTDAPRADMYFPFEQSYPMGTTLFIGTAGDPLGAVAAVQNTLKGIEPAVIFGPTQTLAAIASESVAVTRLALWLLGLFAVVALALAAIGIYGVMSYVVRQRTREIGTRMALGASRADITWTIMRQGGTIAAVGLGLGLAAGLGMARSLDAMLYGVTAADPVTLVGAVVVLALATLGACYVPARRAARVDAARTLGAAG